MAAHAVLIYERTLRRNLDRVGTLGASGRRQSGRRLSASRGGAILGRRQAQQNGRRRDSSSDASPYVHTQIPK
jgi:hypothetical protein